ncbi:4-hydroxy-tetrahydrodipicolinate synthase [Sediminicola luteus]|uniref:4-hydroxy-tetrahydrodipicolinate synthase n=1 Tax=Sediminicola luteus TaxID=319238 RepID=A0A2A4G4T0_9FLAO|nr:4-hydroxy-tetrahydrodipicolinate synthase [Sediminicola luteus]PCE63667.1 4-hydroxy-tetrahydrodipicolinate synthase [Sediminicola luteus]
MKILTGTGVALTTPFTANHEVDALALTALVNHCIDGSIDYLVVHGTTAEPSSLTSDEKQWVTDTVISANAGRLPLVLGVGGNNTAEVVKSLREVDVNTFSAILSVSPYYNKPTQEGIYRHFREIALNSPLPIIVYNVPGRTSSNIEPETLVRLAEEFPNIVAVKEASGNLVQVMEIIAKKPKRFHVISGDDITALPTVLAGGSGVISVLGQAVPQLFSKMIHLGLSGENKEAFHIHYKLQDLMGLIFEEGNPAGIKAMLQELGIGTAEVRLPLVECSKGLREKIHGAMHPLHLQQAVKV